MVENGQEPLFTEIASRGGPLPGSGPGVINPWRGRPAADPAEAAGEHPAPTEAPRPRASPARRPGSAAGVPRSGVRGRAAHGVQWKTAAKPRPMSAGGITRLKRSYQERQADIAAVAALE